MLVLANAEMRGPWTPEDLAGYRQLYALRAHLEAFAARQAALRVAEGASAERLVRRHREMIAAAQRGDEAAFAAADTAFHRGIAELAGTPALVEMWDLVAGRTWNFVVWAYRHVFQDLQGIAVSHRTILDAVSGGHPREAARVASASLDALWQMLADPSLMPTREGDPVERVCIYVLLNLDQRLTLARLASDVAHQSPGHLARCFRAQRGQSLRAYIQGARLRRAASLLHGTELAVQEIGDRVGYADASRFAAHFRRQFGCTPLHWRTKLDSA